MGRNQVISEEELAGLSPESRAVVERQARELVREGKAQAEANAEVLPGALLEAFAGLPEEVAGLRARKPVHWDFVILRRLQSPLLAHLLKVGKKPKAKGAAAGPQTAYSDDQASEMVFQFTRPCEEVELFMQKHGVAGFRRAAAFEIGMKLGPVEVGLLVKMVERELVRYFSTVVKYAAKESGGGAETVFTGPALTPAAKTGSAGGSTTSAG